ncbi:MAG: hypothetical protein HOF90_05095 [Euryarchaeota archaeon]|nr:hypothetical protein [Euryarchaeota archaeon]
MKGSQVRLAGMLTLLLITTLFSPFVPPSSAVITTPYQGESTPQPEFPHGEVNLTTAGFILPANGTMTDAWVNVSTDISRSAGNGTGWLSGDPVSNFTLGSFATTTTDSYPDSLSLSVDNIESDIDDFEMLVPTMANWKSGGPNSLLWSADNLSYQGQQVNTSNGSAVVNSTLGDGPIPLSPPQGNLVVSTISSAPLPAGTHAWITSPELRIPSVQRELYLRMDHWLDLTEGGAWVEYKFDQNPWRLLQPSNLSNHSMSPLAPIPNGSTSGFSAFIGDDNSGWNHDIFLLDNLPNIHSSNLVSFRFVIWTPPNSTSNDTGWSIDNVSFTNTGEPLGAWFHGNLAGAYENDANGWVSLETSTLGLYNPMSISFAIDWDLEGNFNDNLLVEASYNNQTWLTLNPPPGIPGNGIILNNQVYTDSSNGWIELEYPVLSAFQNLTSVWFRFRVITDYAIGYGGGQIDGWEGVMIDDVTLKAANITANITSILLDNFTSSNSTNNGAISNYFNQWQHITAYGHNGPSTTIFDFEEVNLLPSGWFYEHIRGDSGWEIDSSTNQSGWGPGPFMDGSTGAATTMNGRYSDETLSSLITRDYIVPMGANARLRFDHWMCTESNWDGGMILISTDSGDTWQPFGQNETNFYDTISTVNTASPLYNLSIFDGSGAQGGCGSQPWQVKEAGLSDWTGQKVRFKFLFFSDQYIELAGWYIDNVGIEIDHFANSGSWTSPVIDADIFGYGTLSARGILENNTSISASILRPDGTQISGWQNLLLPVTLTTLDSNAHPNIKIQINLLSTNSTHTPVISAIHVGSLSYLIIPPSTSSSWTASGLAWDSQAKRLIPTQSLSSLSSISTFHRPVKTIRLDCECARVVYSVVSSDGTVFLSQMANNGGTISYNNPAFKNIQELIITITVLNNGWINSTEFSAEYLEYSNNPKIDFASDGDVDWQNNGIYGVHSEVDESQLFSQLSNGSLHTFNFTPPVNAYYCGYAVVDVVAGMDVDISFWSQSNAPVNGSSGGPVIETVNGSKNELYIPLCDASLGGSNPQNSSNRHAFSAISQGGDAQVTITKLLIPYEDFTTIHFNSSYLNYLRHTLPINSTTGYFTIPLLITGQGGGFRISGNVQYDWQAKSQFISQPETLFPTGQSYTIWTEHQHMFTNSSFENINLYVGTTRDLGLAEIIISINTSHTPPLVEQLAGSDLLMLNSTTIQYPSGASLKSHYKIGWEFIPQWKHGHHDNLWWMTETTEPPDAPLGPTVVRAGGSTGPAMEIDMESTQFQVLLLEKNHLLSDEGHPDYPLPVMANSSIQVSGFVRFAGSPNLGVGAPNANILVELGNYEDEYIQMTNTSTNITTYTENPAYWHNNYTFSVTNTGDWTGLIELPNADYSILSSGQRIGIRSSVIPIGGAALGGAIDRTITEWVDIIWDSEAPSLGLLMVSPPGGQQPADNHIWYQNRTLPLSIEVLESVRSNDSLELHYWMQEIDDINENSIAEESEYRTIIAQLSKASVRQTVDFPLLVSNDALGENDSSGLISLYITGSDLAGNIFPIERNTDWQTDGFGGSFGLENDLATIVVMPDTPTLLSWTDLTLDLRDGKILPGQVHTFGLIIEEENGLQSLDEILLDLTGDIDGANCSISWQPWDERISADQDCFSQVEVTFQPIIQQGLHDRWEVEFSFVIPWSSSEALANNTWIPSLSVFDLGQEVGLGTGHLTPLEWNYLNEIELIEISLIDITEPYGSVYGEVLHISDDDMVELSVIPVYHGTNIPLNIDMEIMANVDGGIIDQSMQYYYYANAQPVLMQIIFNGSIFPNAQAELNVIGEINYSGFQISHIQREVILDDESPRLSLPLASLQSIRTDQMQMIPLTFQINEPQQMNSDVNINWQITGAENEEIEGAGIAICNLLTQADGIWYYDVVLNISLPSEIDLSEEYNLFVWISATDIAGNELIGTGSNNSKQKPKLLIYQFVPRLIEMSASNPSHVGDMLTVNATIHNYGYYDGKVTLQLLEGEVVLDEITANLNSLQSETLTLSVESWRDGDYEFTIIIEGYNDSQFINFEIQADSIQAANAALLYSTLSIIVLFLSLAVFIVIRSRKFSANIGISSESEKEYENLHYTQEE